MERENEHFGEFGTFCLVLRIFITQIILDLQRTVTSSKGLFLQRKPNKILAVSLHLDYNNNKQFDKNKRGKGKGERNELKMRENEKKHNSV